MDFEETTVNVASTIRDVKYHATNTFSALSSISFIEYCDLDTEIKHKLLDMCLQIRNFVNNCDQILKEIK